MDKKMGKLNRERGARFELKVRKDLEKKGWIVDRWSNNIDYPDSNIEKPLEEREDMKIVPARSRFGLRTTGFPDFIAFKERVRKNETRIGFDIVGENLYEVIGVECKSKGYLDKIEKEKCKWYLSNNVFSKILIASKGKKRGEIVYKEFK